MRALSGFASKALPLHFAAEKKGTLGRMGNL